MSSAMIAASQSERWHAFEDHVSRHSVPEVEMVPIRCPLAHVVDAYGDVRGKDIGDTVPIVHPRHGLVGPRDVASTGH